MTTLQQDWQDFKAKCHPNGMTAEQNKQLHCAFVAGAFAAVMNVQEIPDMPEAEQMPATKKYVGEILMAEKQIVENNTNRN